MWWIVQVKQGPRDKASVNGSVRAQTVRRKSEWRELPSYCWQLISLMPTQNGLSYIYNILFIYIYFYLACIYICTCLLKQNYLHEQQKAVHILRDFWNRIAEENSWQYTQLLKEVIPVVKHSCMNDFGFFAVSIVMCNGLNDFYQR